MSKLESALAWAGRGFKVFPLAAGTKKPLFGESWPEISTTDPEQITRWWRDELTGTPRDHNIGCDCTGWIVADLDRKNGKDGVREFERMGGQLGQTLTVRTPTGGFHSYFDSQGLDFANSAGLIAPGIDVRAFRGYTLAPGSEIDGVAYTIEVEAPIADAPGFVWERLKLAEPRRAAASLATDADANLALAARVAAESPPAVEGSGGDAQTYKVACAVRDCGVTEWAAAEILAEHWNPRCSPPWDLDELRAKVGNAYAYAQRAEGEKSPAAMFGGVSIPALPSGFVSFGELLTRDVPPVEYLIPGLIEKGVATFLSAPGGTHKSRLAIQWGLSLDAGAPIFGETVERSAFVYVSYEDHADEVARRAQLISKRLNLAGIGGHYCDLAGEDSPLAIVHEDGTYKLMPFWKTLTEYLKAIPGHKFVVLDSTYDALRFAGQAKINETSVMLGISLLQKICKDCDATVMPLWHPSQAGQERGDASGWSVAWHNKPRARLSIKGVSPELNDAFDLKVEKHNHGPKGKIIRLYWCDGVLLPRTELEEADQENRLLMACVAVATEASGKKEAITRRGKLAGWVATQVNERTGQRIAGHTIKNALEQAVFLGMLRYQRGQGKTKAGYLPVDDGENQTQRTVD